ncbi:unnamed protein product [Sympodiomycopsis kandeliae]
MSNKLTDEAKLTAAAAESLILSSPDRHDWQKSKFTILRQNRKCVILSILLLFSSFFSGYERSVSSSFVAMPAFIEKFGVDYHGKKVISSGFQQGLQGLTVLGAIVMNLVQWWLSQRFLGRVQLAHLASWILVLAVVMQIGAPNRGLFCFGRFLMGIGDAGVRYAMLLWVAESAVPPIRAMLTGLINFKASLGSLVGLLVNRAYSHGMTPRYYRMPLIIGLGPQALSIMMLFMIPESPRWLISHGRREDAQKSLMRLRSADGATEEAIEAEIREVEMTLALEKATAAEARQKSSNEGPCTLLSRVKQHRLYGAATGNNRKRLILCAACGTFFVSCGYDMVVSGYTYLLKILDQPDPFEIVIINSTLSIVAYALHVAYFADGLPRRRLLLTGFTISACCMLAVAVAFTVHKADMATKRLVMNIFFPLSNFSDAAILGAIPHALANEVPPEEFRSEFLAIHWMVYYSCITLNDVIQPYWINITKFNIGGQVAWIYAFTSALSLVFIYFVVPETHGLSLSEIDLLFNAKVTPLQSAGWISEYRKRI